MNELYNLWKTKWNQIQNTPLPPFKQKKCNQNEWQYVIQMHNESPFSVLKNLEDETWSGTSISIPLMNQQKKKSKMTLFVWEPEGTHVEKEGMTNLIQMIQWFHECFTFPNVEWKLNVVLSDEKKEIEKTICSKDESCFLPKHVNSGVTVYYPDETFEIFIWRKEEGWKVLFHECFHALRMDSLLPSPNSQELETWYQMIPMKPKKWFLPQEGIVEIGASFVSSLFDCPSLEKRSSRKNKIKVVSYQKWQQKMKQEQFYVHYQLQNIFSLSPKSFLPFLLQPHLPIIDSNRIQTHSSLFGYYFVRSAIYFQWSIWKPIFLHHFLHSSFHPIHPSLITHSLQNQSWIHFLQQLNQFHQPLNHLSMKMTLFGNSF